MLKTSLNVLIVDDMLTMRKIVSKCCKEIGLENLTEAKNGQEAFEKLKDSEHTFDLIISDWNMPEMTGIELLKSVRGDNTYKELPFLLVTAESEQHQIIEAVQSGVDAYITKPFTAATLKEKLEQVAGKYPALKA